MCFFGDFTFITFTGRGSSYKLLTYVFVDVVAVVVVIAGRERDRDTHTHRLWVDFSFHVQRPRGDGGGGGDCCTWLLLLLMLLLLSVVGSFFSIWWCTCDLTRQRGERGGTKWISLLSHT